MLIAMYLCRFGTNSISFCVYRYTSAGSRCYIFKGSAERCPERCLKPFRAALSFQSPEKAHCYRSTATSIRS